MNTILKAAKENTAIEVNEGADNDALFINREGMRQLLDRTFENGSKLVIERIKQILPNIDLPDFDHSKEKDTLYCVEWGIAKGQWMEQGVLERLIRDLTREP